MIYRLPSCGYRKRLTLVVALLDRHIACGHGERVLLRDA